MIAGCALFLALYYHAEALHWREKHDDLLAKPLSYWQQRDIRRELEARAANGDKSIEALFTERRFEDVRQPSFTDRHRGY